MKHSFAPLVNDDCTLLILGSLPGDESLRQVQYYAHPCNAFWRILCEVFAEDFTEDYAERCDIALRHGVALWDVIGTAEREGSLDTAIRNPAVNDFATFLREHPNIRKICLNGGKAEQLFKRHCMCKNGTLNADLIHAINVTIKDTTNTEREHPINATTKNTSNTEREHTSSTERTKCTDPAKPSTTHEAIKIIALPSTSPANAKMRYDEKLSLWRAAILD